MNYSERARWWTLLGDDAEQLAPPAKIKFRGKKKKAKSQSNAPGSDPAGLFGKITAFVAGLGPARQKKELRLCETVPLGDKRFVAVVQFEDQRFLVGSSSNGISLLSELSTASSSAGASITTKEFGAVLKQHLEGDRPAV